MIVINSIARGNAGIFFCGGIAIMFWLSAVLVSPWWLGEYIACGAAVLSLIALYLWCRALYQVTKLLGRQSAELAVLRESNQQHSQEERKSLR